MKVYKVKINGSLFYYKDKNETILHREDGPARIWADGTKWWYLNGALHRMDGPAFEYSDDGTDQWYINGEFIFETDRSGNITRRMY